VGRWLSLSRSSISDSIQLFSRQSLARLAAACLVQEPSSHSPVHFHSCSAKTPFKPLPTLICRRWAVHVPLCIPHRKILLDQSTPVLPLTPLVIMPLCSAVPSVCCPLH
jgi:hypothetical protein